MHVELWVSGDHTHFGHAKLPVDMKKLQENSFSLLHDLEEQTIVLAVRTVSGSDSTLYTSGSFGQHWSPSLQRVHYGVGRAADIFSIEGVAGVYLANQVSVFHPASKTATSSSRKCLL